MKRKEAIAVGRLVRWHLLWSCVLLVTYDVALAADTEPPASVYERTFNDSNSSSQFEKPPTKVETLGDKVLTGVKWFASALGKHQKQDLSILKMYKKSSFNSRHKYFLHQAALQGDQDYETVSKASTISNAMAKQTKDLAGNLATSTFESYIPYKNGFRFDLNISGDSPSKKQEAHPKAIRYGLVLKKINPDFSGGHIASVSSMQHELGYAGKAQVEWSVEPVTTKRSQYAPQVASPDYDQANVSSQAEAIDSSVESDWQETALKEDASGLSSRGDFWQRYSTPKAKFKGRVVPKKFKMKDLASGKLPGSVVSLSQVDGLYRVDYVTKEGLEKESVFHNMNLPLYKRLSIRRKYDESWDSQETVVDNLQLVGGRPRFTLISRDQINQYSCRVAVEKRSRSVIFSVDTPENWKSSDGFGGKKGEKYEIKLQRSF